METVSLPQQNLDGLDWRARNQLKFRNKVGSRFVPATSNPLLERLMSMASPERRRSSPEKTRSSRLPDHSSSSNPTKASAPRKQVLKASSKSKVGATSSSSTQQKRKRVILADSESDDPLAGPHPKVPKRTNRIAGLSSKGSNRASAPVGEKGNGDPDSKTANALPLRDISKKDATGLTHTVAPSRRRQNILSCIIEQDDVLVKKTSVATVRTLKSRTRGTQALVSGDDNELGFPPTKVPRKTTLKATLQSETLSKKGYEEKSPNLTVLSTGSGPRPYGDYDRGLDAEKPAPQLGNRETITSSYGSSATSRKPFSASVLVKSDPKVCVVRPMKERKKEPTSKTSKKPPAAARHESDLDSDNAHSDSTLAIRRKPNPASNVQPSNSPPNPRMETFSNPSVKSGGSKGPATRKPKVPVIPASDNDSDDEPLIIPMPKKLRASTIVQGVSPPGRSRVARRDDSVMQMQTLSRKTPMKRSKVLTKDHNSDPEAQAGKKIAGARFVTTKPHDSSHGRSPSPEIPKIRSARSDNTRKRKAANLDDMDVGSDEEYGMTASSSSATLVQQKTSSDERLARVPTKRTQISKRVSLVAIEAEVDEEAETLNKQADEVSFALQTPADEKISEGRRSVRSANVKTPIEAKAPILQNGQRSITTEMENSISLGPSKKVGMEARASRLVSSNTPVGDALSEPIIPQTKTSSEKRSSRMASRLGLSRISSIKTTISRPKGPSSNPAGRRKPPRHIGPPSEIDEMDLFAR